MTKWAQAMAAIEARLRAVFVEQYVARNRDVRTAPDANGDVMLFDGEEQEREEFLGTTTKVLTWSAEVNIYVQLPSPAERDAALDSLVAQMAGVFSVEPVDTLDGLVNYVVLDGVDYITEPVEGGADIKASIVTIVFQYDTNSLIT